MIDIDLNIDIEMLLGHYHPYQWLIAVKDIMNEVQENVQAYSSLCASLQLPPR